MSCSSYCQGLQSCLEPARLVEPRVLRLKLAPPKSNTWCSSPAARNCNNFFVAESDGDSTSNNTDNVDMGGWSCLQSLATNSSSVLITSKTKENDDTEKDNEVYMPPNFKRSSSILSTKSLEMCTESLGSETGSDGGESSDEMGLLSSEYANNESRQRRTRSRETRKNKRNASFPPPLTSISGSTNVQFRPYREEGRLILEAVSVRSCQAYFHAERIDGRLRLHLLKNRYPNSYNEEKQEQEVAAVAAASEEEEEESSEETSIEEDGEENIARETEDGEAEEKWEEEMEENDEGEMGIKKMTRPSRCKESEGGNKSLLNWEPFWVAT